MIGNMKRKLEYSGIPIRSAVIAWQPAFLRRYEGSSPSGAVAAVRLYDPAVLSYAMTHGACWCDWAEQSVCELVEALEWLKGVMAKDYGIALRHIDAAFAVIPEYRRHKLLEARCANQS